MKKIPVFGKITIAFFAFLSLIFSFSVKAGSPTLVKSQSVLNGPDWSFRENKGQLMDENRNPLNEIPFYGKQGGVNIYCKPGEISFVFTKSENDNKISEATGKPTTLDMNGTITSKFRTPPLRGGAGGGASPLSFGESLSRQSGRSGVRCERADLILLNSNPSATITPSALQSYYENYYTTGDADHGITNVRTYKTITYKNIYPNIDMVLEAKPNGMEYSFIVYPGGNVSDIQLQWNGLDNIKQLENGGIEYALPNSTASASIGASASVGAGFTPAQKSPLGDLGGFTESPPICYQPTTVGVQNFEPSRDRAQNFAPLPTPSPENTTNLGSITTLSPLGRAGEGLLSGVEPIPSSLTHHGSRISFSVPNYDKSKTLIIDPTLSWGTYYGGSGNDYANAAATDSSNNIYITGVSSGDIFLAKFTPSCGLSYTTYYGNGTAYGIAIDSSNNIYITGEIQAGSLEVFLAKFTPAGKLSWGIKYSSSSDIAGYGVSVDRSNNVYFTGRTWGTSSLITSGAYQTSYTGGGNDGEAFLAKFNSSGSRVWATYYGGTGFANGIAINDSNYVYITGLTTSDSGLATSGAYKTSNSGNGDAFLAKFDSSGIPTYATYYGGKGADEANGIVIDKSDNIYITGLTFSDSGIATSGAYQTNGGGVYGFAFLAKFDISGNLSWATYYGGWDGEEAHGIALDNSNNIYITGVTESWSGIATLGAYQTSLVGYYNAFLAQFRPSGKLLGATYYGGDPYDAYNEADGIAIDKSNNIYISGYTGSSSGIATAGAYKTSFTGAGTGTYDAFLAKFSFKLYNNDAGVVDISTPSLCQGSQNLKVNIGNFGLDSLKSDSIYWKVNGVAQKAIYWAGSLALDSSVSVVLGGYNYLSGSDTIVVWSVKPNGVIDSSHNNDSAKIIVNFNSSPLALTGTNKAICYGSSDSIGAFAVSGDIYSWTSNPSGFSDTIPNPSVSPTTTTTYYLTETITATGCSKSDSVIIIVNHLPSVNAGRNSTICSGSFDTIGAPSLGGNSYLWTSYPSGFSSTISNPTVNPTVTTTYYIIATNSCGSNSDTITITVNPLPSSPNAGRDTSICSNTPIYIGDTSVAGDTYNWSSRPSGFSDTSYKPIVSPTITTTYYLTETNQSGCSGSDSVVITVFQLPAAGITVSSKLVCTGSSVTLTDTSTYMGANNRFQWSVYDIDTGLYQIGYVGRGKTIHFAPSVWGTYMAGLSVINGSCTSQLLDSNVFTVYAAYANFSVDTIGYINTPLHFTNLSRSSPNSSNIYKYQWAFGDTSSVDTAANPAHTYLHTGVYTVKLTAINDSTGCMDTLAKKITILPAKNISALFYAPDTACTHTSIPFSDTSKSNNCGTINHFLWSFGDNGTSTAQNPTHTYNTAGVFPVKLTVSSSGGCTDSFTKNIFVDSTCVWPGDANNDKLVDTNDVLYIGIAYGEIGAKRANASTNWDAQYCGNWANTFANGANHKHADCNGDGVIDSNDISVVNLNWGDTHPKTGLLSATNPANPPFFLTFSKTIYNPGDTVNAAIMLGSSANPLSNVYGMASAFKFDLAYVDTNTLKINFSKSWFGTPGSDMLYFLRPQYATGALLFAITRIDHKNTSGNGSIGALSFIIPKNAPLSKSVNFTPGSAKLIAFNQTIVPISLPKDTFAVQTTTGIQNLENEITDISIYPNPATATLTILSPSNPIQSITIYDATGRIVGVQNFEPSNFGKVYDVHNLPAGMYFIKLGFGNGSYTTKFMKQ